MFLQNWTKDVSMTVAGLGSSTLHMFLQNVAKDVSMTMADLGSRTWVFRAIRNWKVDQL
jgi:hypothetical protein